MAKKDGTKFTEEELCSSLFEGLSLRGNNLVSFTSNFDVNRIGEDGVGGIKQNHNNMCLVIGRLFGDLPLLFALPDGSVEQARDHTTQQAGPNGAAAAQARTPAATTNYQNAPPLSVLDRDGDVVMAVRNAYRKGLEKGQGKGKQKGFKQGWRDYAKKGGEPRKGGKGHKGEEKYIKKWNKQGKVYFVLAPGDNAEQGK